MLSENSAMKNEKGYFPDLPQLLSTVLEKFQAFSLWTRRRHWTHACSVHFSQLHGGVGGHGWTFRGVKAMSDEEKEGREKWKLESG